MNFYYHINVILKRIESVFCIGLCLVLIVTSKVNKSITDDISMFFVDISAPIVKIGSEPFNKILGSITGLDELLRAKAENRILREENEKLKSLYLKSLNINQENKELKELMKYVGIRSAKYHVARFIGYSHQLYSNGAFIDAGYKSGIKEDSIVTGKNSLIGRISQVGRDKARILLVTDINSRIPVITSKARARGILAGNNTELMEIVYLENNHGISVGDMVFTSGDGDYLPPGILIGVVKKVDHNYVAVKMVEDISDIDLVGIIEY